MEMTIEQYREAGHGHVPDANRAAIIREYFQMYAITDIEASMEAYFQKYGKALQPFDFRDDADEKLLACIFMAALRAEIGDGLRWAPLLGDFSSTPLPCSLDQPNEVRVLLAAIRHLDRRAPQEEGQKADWQSQETLPTRAGLYAGRGKSKELAGPVHTSSSSSSSSPSANLVQDTMPSQPVTGYDDGVDEHDIAEGSWSQHKPET